MLSSGFSGVFGLFKLVYCREIWVFLGYFGFYVALLGLYVGFLGFWVARRFG